jgi:hypothetical protein
MKTGSSHAQRFLVLGYIAASIAGCSGGQADTEMQPVSLRPGVEDSSKIFKGTPSKAENDFWNAIRNGDEAGRAGATAELKADVAKDPTNGYSAFLAAVNAFMPNSDVPRTLVGRVAPPPSTPFPDDTSALLEQAIAHLTDPMYLGFSATLLAGIQVFTDPAEASKTQALAVKNNVPAGSVGQLNVELRAGNLAGARDVMSSVLDYCTGAPLDRANPALDAYVDKANAADLVHRECYSGFHATHGTEGILFITGDLVALSGNPALAQRYYAAAKRATNYPFWPLRPVLDRRMSGEQPITGSELAQAVACSTCHVSELK